MARVLFKRGTTEEIETLPTEDGAFIVDTITGKTYIDTHERRIQIPGSETPLIDEKETPSDTNTYNANAINELVKDVYSTEEQVIGTWIDGKPLYRRVIEFTTTGTTTNIAQIDEISKIIGMRGIVSYGEGAYHNIGAYANANFYSLLQYETGTGMLKLFSTSNYLSGCVILEYTKTTD